MVDALGGRVDVDLNHTILRVKRLVSGVTGEPVSEPTSQVSSAERTIGTAWSLPFSALGAG